MRVHELAKQLGLSSKELIVKLEQLGVSAKSHMSTLDDDTVTLATAELGGKKSQPPHTAPAAVKEVIEPVKKVQEIVAEASISSAAVKIQFPISVGALATKLNVRTGELIKTLMGVGIFATVNQLLNHKVAQKVSELLNIPIEHLPSEEEKVIREHATEKDSADLVFRPPVVTLMGHVDHGKTSLLDAVRQTNVAAREAGRITQHIGAHGVTIKDKGYVTFLDTPGHGAFTAMRARGANLTDVVVLVVAADDGVMPQTIEAIDHARAANCPIVVAVNKSDLPTANPEKVKRELQKRGLAPEEWGGKTIFVNVSAKTGQGIDALLDMLLLEAEVLELKANPKRDAQGVVVESRLTKSHGPVATVLVQNGTLRLGDYFICGVYYGKVRAMHDDRGKVVKEAAPSHAAAIQGLAGVPEAGDLFFVTKDEETAKDIAEKRQLELREKAMSGALHKHLSLDDLRNKIEEGEIQELKIIIKGDVQGSIEALTSSLEKLSSPKMKLKVIHGATGGINDSDIMLAAASDAIVIGFHVKPELGAQGLIEQEGVDVRYYNIIYEAVEDVKNAMEGLLKPHEKEVTQGMTEIREIFKASKVGTVGGAVVLKGRLSRQHRIRLIRNNIIVHEGKLSSLKRFKDDVKEVPEGYECGLVVEGYNDIKTGDRVESYKVEKVAAKL